ncbi:MAG: hypothetical protein K5871_06100 [Lachnospiraceae bacterium]|nr:hypothetical protein [Lachnospiraceae bacterium]
MLFNLLIWIYVFLTTYALGRLLFSVLGTDVKKTFGNAGICTEDICMAGFMVSTVYAQIFSIFAGVGLAANIFLVFVCIIFYLTRFIKSTDKKFSSFIKKISPSKCILIMLLSLIMAYGASRGYFHFDSDLYHGQAIHWIEDYGVVKGLGNLNGRLAYNSSSFAVQALYSFAFLGGRSYHACAGFMALLVMISGLRIFHVFKDRKVFLSDFARIASIYYVLNIYDEISSPASDYFTMLLICYIAVRLIEGAENRADADFYAMPVLLAFFDLTVKLSAAPLCMAVLIPLVMLIKEKRYKQILKYAVCVLAILLPFFIRNYFLSGWLMYPSTAIDIFDPDWKISAQAAEIDADYIIAFGRGFSNMDSAHYAFSEWFPHWMSGLGRTEKVLLLSSFAGMIVWLCGMIFSIAACRKKENDKNYVPDYIILAYAVSFAFWLFSSPLVRYGQGYILMLPLLTFGSVYVRIIDALGEKKAAMYLSKGAICFIGLFVAYKGIMLGKYMKSVDYEPYYVQPQDYGVYETYKVDLGGGHYVYAPVEGDQTGYYDFPSVPVNLDLPELYEPDADDFSGGFMS